MSCTASYAGMTTPVKDKEGHGIPCLQPIDVVECTYQYFTKSPTLKDSLFCDFVKY